MKLHKYWSLGALFCMLGCIYSGIKKSMTAHKYFAYSSFARLCFLFCFATAAFSSGVFLCPFAISVSSVIPL